MSWGNWFSINAERRRNYELSMGGKGKMGREMNKWLYGILTG